MKNKNEIAVKITDKNRKKVKAILEMFGEKLFSDESLDFNCIRYNSISYKWSGIAESLILAETLVKPKELKQILSREKLREGDYIKTTYGDIKKCDVFWFDTLNFKRYATKEEIAKFEGKKELQVGKWYKHDSGSLCLVEGIDESGNVYGYEIDTFGVWLNYTNQDGAICLLNSIAKKSVKEATPQDVGTALIEEAKRRGYKVGCNIKSFVCGNTPIEDSHIHYRGDSNTLVMGGAWIFKNGKWAEVIEVDKFAELKEAHENGAVIEFKSHFKPFEWIDVSNNKPSWNSSYEYRIKPDDKPKVGDICKFWDNEEDNCIIGIYKEHTGRYHTHTAVWGGFDNAKVLTQEEVIELLFKK